MPPRIAVVDIGTNTLLLLVVEPDGEGGLRRVRDEVRFGRLGKGLGASGRLADESIARSLEAVRDYRAIMDELGVERVAVVGTQALREASNARAFVDPAEEMFGAKVEVISGDREAELVTTSVVRSMPELAGERFAIADVGGGSTEIIICDAGAVTWFRSLPLGSVRHTERHLVGDPPTAEQATALVADLDAALAEVPVPEGALLVGTAGTATTIAAMELELAAYDPDRIDGTRLPADAVDRRLEQLLSLPVAERLQLPGLERERADVIAAGVAIYARLLRRMKAPTFAVSDRGVRWGLAYEMADRVG